MCTNTFLYKKYILHYPNFNKYPVSTEHPKNGVGSVWALKGINQSFVSLFPKTLVKDDSSLLIVTLKVVYFLFLRKVFERQWSLFCM